MHKYVRQNTRLHINTIKKVTHKTWIFAWDSRARSGSGGVCFRWPFSVWAAARSASDAGASAGCRCGCTWPDSRGTASAGRCASGSGASGWTPLCRTTCSATARCSRRPRRTCCGTSTVGRADPTRAPGGGLRTTLSPYHTWLYRSLRCAYWGDLVHQNTQLKLHGFCNIPQFNVKKKLVINTTDKCRSLQYVKIALHNIKQCENKIALTACIKQNHIK